MKNGLLLKKEIKHSFGGFVTIAVAVMLMVSFIVGSLMCVPSLRNTADSYYRTCNFWDINIKSDLGFTNEDIRVVMGEESVEKAVGAISLEVVSAVNGGGNYATDIYGIDFDALQMNSAALLAAPQFVYGSAPINNNSCVAVISPALKNDINIGDNITISGNTGICRETSFTVTGIMISPQYVSATPDVSDSGATVSLALYVPKDVFLTDGSYTDIYVTLEGATDISSFSKKYEEMLTGAAAKITEIGEQRAAIRSESLETENLSDIDKAQKQYDFIKSENDSQLKETKNTIDKLKKEIDAAAEQIEEKEKSVAAAKAALDSKTAEIEAIKAKGNAATPAEAAALSKYNADLAAYNTAEVELQEMKTTHEMNNATYKSLQKDYEVYQKLASEKLTAAQQSLDDAKNGVLSDYTQNWYITTRSENTGFADFKDNSKKINAALITLAFAFSLTAVLTVYTVISRLLYTRSADNALLKTLGYSDLFLTNKYLGFALVSGIIGGVLGVAIGYAAMPKLLFKALSALYVFPEFKLKFAPLAVIVGGIAVAAVTVPVTLYLCRKCFRGEVKAMASPIKAAADKPIFLTKCAKIWDKIPVMWRGAIRNILADKKRLVLSLISIAGGAAMLLTGLGVKNSANNIAARQYEKIQNYQIEISLVEGTDYAASEYFAAYLASPDKVTDYMPVFSETAVVTIGEKQENVSLVVPIQAEKTASYITLRSPIIKSRIDFGEASVVITNGFAKAFDIGKGDKITLSVSSGATNEFTVTDICENYIGNFIYINPQKYSEIAGNTPAANYLYIKSPNAVQDSETETKLLSLGVAGNVEFNYDKAVNVAESTQNADYLAVAFILAALLLLTAVNYNAVAVGFNSRRDEFSALKNAGMPVTAVAAYIFREAAIITVLGTIIGLIAGTVLHMLIVACSNTLNVTFISGIGFMPYLIAVLATGALAAAVNSVFVIKNR